MTRERSIIEQICMTSFMNGPLPVTVNSVRMKVEHVCGNFVKEVSVVRYNEQCARPVLKVTLQPNDCLQRNKTKKNKSTVTIWIPDKSGIQMVDLCPVVKWSGIGTVVWKPDWKKPLYGQKCLVFELSAKSRDFTIWIPDTHIVQYSDESCIQVFGIQMETIHQ